MWKKVNGLPKAQVGGPASFGQEADLRMRQGQGAPIGAGDGNYSSSWDGPAMMDDSATTTPAGNNASNTGMGGWGIDYSEAPLGSAANPYPASSQSDDDEDATKTTPAKPTSTATTTNTQQNTSAPSNAAARQAVAQGFVNTLSNIATVAPAIAGYYSARNAARDAKRAAHARTSEDIFGAVSGTKGDYGITGSSYTRYNPQGWANSYAGMNKMTYAKYGGPQLPMAMYGDIIPLSTNLPVLNMSERDYMIPPPARDNTAVYTPVTPTPAFTAPSTSNDVRELIAKHESGGDYGALPKDKSGKLVSSAVGKYQFLWNSHKGNIADVTGIKDKETFRKSPEAQEKYYTWYDNNVLTPIASSLHQLAPSYSISDLKRLVHFQGPSGARRYLTTGKYTADAFGSTPTAYLNKKSKYGGHIKEGDVMDVSQEELNDLISKGYKVAYI